MSIQRILDSDGKIDKRYAPSMYPFFVNGPIIGQTTPALYNEVGFKFEKFYPYTITSNRYNTLISVANFKLPVGIWMVTVQFSAQSSIPNTYGINFLKVGVNVVGGNEDITDFRLENSSGQFGQSNINGANTPTIFQEENNLVVKVKVNTDAPTSPLPIPGSVDFTATVICIRVA
jgi:hypothetical protein